MAAKVSAFADEISKDLGEQIDGLNTLNIRYIALRGCFGKNIMDWSADDCRKIKSALDAAGIGVSEIGSPIGKTAIDEPFEKTAFALGRAIEMAKYFETPNIRLFSFWPPANGEKTGWQQNWRGEVLSRLQAMVDLAAGHGIMLMLENEAELYGDYPDECVDIFENVKGQPLAMAFDFANFVSRKEIDVYDAWRRLKPYVRHIHVKDHMPAARSACVAGEGLGKIPQILPELAADDYSGFLTLEPHLAQAGRMSGFTGLERFKAAAEALATLCRQAGLKTE